MKKITLFTFFISMTMILLFFPVNMVNAAEIAVIFDAPASTADSPTIDLQHLPKAPEDEKEDDEDNGDDDGEDDSDGFDRLWDVSSLG